MVEQTEIRGWTVELTIGRTDRLTVWQTNRQMNRQTDLTDWQLDTGVITTTDKHTDIIDILE